MMVLNNLHVILLWSAVVFQDTLDTKENVSDVQIVVSLVSLESNSFTRHRNTNNPEIKFQHLYALESTKYTPILHTKMRHVMEKLQHRANQIMVVVAGMDTSGTTDSASNHANVVSAQAI